ncbi:heteromeric transposase endonuclease subunit TnsA [Sulfurimonas lithotrophica]|uniref:Heteromeric transposase endonuclease subunit TnsA n=1 Tax=Sulfurimonas lithotrophica TaxID=2590022 RepID=A0A5P8P2E2_9BACT|nr:TnsA endonuclease N-terminal domain-containing protein [Sulfurimonas lithotrophica]QFR49791.1 heteromeric transposase endonuclease subunit TnsA [Sulfurimonas lithotrophica]
MPVRKLKKSYISCVGYFKSYKNDRQQAFDSILEREWFLYFEFDKNVASYAEQPYHMYYQLNGVKTRYTPDILVTYRDGSQKLFEVKYQDEIDSDEDLQHKLFILKNEVPKQKHHPFDVLTDVILDTIYMKNCAFLYKYAFLQENQELSDKVETAINNYDTSISVNSLLEDITTNQQEQLMIMPYVWKKVFDNPTLIDMNEKITKLSKINLGAINE